jgi:hypothetical protein
LVKRNAGDTKGGSNWLSARSIPDAIFKKLNLAAARARVDVEGQPVERHFVEEDFVKSLHALVEKAGAMILQRLLTAEAGQLNRHINFAKTRPARLA